MTIDAKLEVTLKFSTLPNARPAGQGKMAFALKIPDGQFVTVAVNNKAWGKLVKAAKEWPPWVVALSGTMGERTEKGFMRVNPGLQVFECKLKAPADAPASIAFSRAGDGHHRRGHGHGDEAHFTKLEAERPYAIRERVETAPWL